MAPESNSSDHDLLIELRTLVKFQMDEQSRTLAAHEKDDIAAMAVLSSKVDSAHSRMDTLRKELFDMLSKEREAIQKETRDFRDSLLKQITSLEITVGNFGSMKDKVLGGAVVVMFLFSTVLTLIAIFHHPMLVPSVTAH